MDEAGLEFAESKNVRSQPISGNGVHDNNGRGEKVSAPKVEEIGGIEHSQRVAR